MGNIVSSSAGHDHDRRVERYKRCSLEAPILAGAMTLQSETGRLDEGDPEVMNEWFKVFHETSSRLDVCRWCDGHRVAGCLLIEDESGRTV
jgi:hypothetical protein